MLESVIDSGVAVRFWAKVERGDAAACWPWTGHRDDNGYGLGNGYGRFRLGGQNGPRYYAHRLAYELLIGPIPEGLVIDHLCSNRACVNPAHMEPVSIAENVRRGREVRRAAA